MEKYTQIEASRSLPSISYTPEHISTLKKGIFFASDRNIRLLQEPGLQKIMHSEELLGELYEELSTTLKNTSQPVTQEQTIQAFCKLLEFQSSLPHALSPRPNHKESVQAWYTVSQDGVLTNQAKRLLQQNSQIFCNPSATHEELLHIIAEHLKAQSNTSNAAD